MSGRNPWSVVAHEDIAPEPKPKPVERDDPPARRSGPPMPLGLTMSMPPDLLEAVEHLSATQSELGVQLEKITAAIADAATGIAELQGQLVDVVADVRQAQIDMAEAFRQQQAATHAQCEAMAAVIAQTNEAVLSMRTAVLAPRRVTLKRDAEGNAVEAVSEVTQTEAEA